MDHKDKPLTPEQMFALIHEAAAAVQTDKTYAPPDAAFTLETLQAIVDSGAA